MKNPKPRKGGYRGMTNSRGVPLPGVIHPVTAPKPSPAIIDATVPLPPEPSGVWGITGDEILLIISQTIKDIVGAMSGGLSVGEIIAVFALTAQRLAQAAEGGAVQVLNTVAAVLFALASMWGYSAKRAASGRFRATPK